MSGWAALQTSGGHTSAWLGREVLVRVAKVTGPKSGEPNRASQLFSRPYRTNTAPQRARMTTMMSTLVVSRFSIGISPVCLDVIRAMYVTTVEVVTGARELVHESRC